MYRLITISCYFGKLPEHFPEFLRSLAMNPTVDFLLVTDNEVASPPANVQIFNCSFDDMKARIQSVVEFPIVLDRPYKLCDYKPIWGIAFGEYIEGYDFWGHCDIDLIFGDIRSYLPEDVLKKSDKIYQLGHLTYYRNTDENNLRYRMDGGVDYREAFTSPEIFAFDEIAGIGNIYEKHGFPTYYSRDYADITYGKVRFTLSYFHVPPELAKENNYEKQVFYWEDGHVYRAYLKDEKILQDEFNYIHFSKRKMSRNDLPENCSAFFISNNGLFPKTGEVDFADFDRYNPTEPMKEVIRNWEVGRTRRRQMRRYYWNILKRKLSKK